MIIFGCGYKELFLSQSIAVLGIVICLIGLLSPVFGQKDQTRSTVISEPRSLERSREESSKVVYLRPAYNCPVTSDAVANRIFAEYGSILAARGDVVLPDRCVFETDAEVSAFQQRVRIRGAAFGNAFIELQEAALAALLKAQSDAAREGRKLTPLDGAIAGRRSFADTVRLWNSRFYPALNHWTRRGRITADEAEEARGATLREQVRKVLDWEARGVFFSTDFSNSVMTSVAPPGTSQHLSLLAFDVAEYADPVVSAAMNRNGWFQTVPDDPPHFTYLGSSVSDLPKRELRLIYRGRYSYWIPNLPPVTPP